MLLRLREIPLELDEEESQLPQKIAALLQFPAAEISAWGIVRIGIDARKKSRILRVYTVDFEVEKGAELLAAHQSNQRLVKTPENTLSTGRQIKCKPEIVVVGMGPAGLFAALELAEAGAKVTLLERGKPVKERLQDVRKFWNERQLNPESNIQFGEGGAGTFSDGKLTSRLNHPHMRSVLQTMVRFGAPEEILYLAKPHVGSDRLRGVLVNFRQHLQQLGVDIRFSSKLTALEQKHGKVQGVIINDAEQLQADQLVLAVGHSARDTYQMLHGSGLAMERKAFAVGLRVEHPLELINRIQYGMEQHPRLPAAEYSLAWNNKQTGRGVYSFCMCPGGTVVNAASEPGRLVVNGMSNFKRNAELSNSALVVAVRPDDFDGLDPLAGVRFQRHWEEQAYLAGGEDWSAPAQPLLEFLQGQSGRLRSSCQPQVTHVDLASCLPGIVTSELRQALPHFNRRMKGFISAEATLIGVETRTSAPLRLLRNAEGESVSHPGVFPAGEGAGYAGGIMSAAVDGMKIAHKIIAKYDV
jgi:uncharacterized FAD-dependent dehydrogenase